MNSERSACVYESHHDCSSAFENGYGKIKKKKKKNQYRVCTFPLTASFPSSVLAQRSAANLFGSEPLFAAHRALLSHNTHLVSRVPVDAKASDGSFPCVLSIAHLRAEHGHTPQGKCTWHSASLPQAKRQTRRGPHSKPASISLSQTPSGSQLPGQTEDASNAARKARAAREAHARGGTGRAQRRGARPHGAPEPGGRRGTGARPASSGPAPAQPT